MASLGSTTVIKLLFVDHTPFAGGAQLVLADHIAALDKTQFEVHVACTDTVPLLVERYQAAGATVHLVALELLRDRHPRVLLHLFRAQHQLRRLMNQLGIHLVISNTTRASYVAVLAVLGTRIPVVWWVRDFLYPKALFALLKWRVAAIICVSHAIKRIYLAENDPRGVVVYVASNLYQQLPQVTEVMVAQERARWGFTPETVVVGFMGRLVAEKGPEDLVAAVAQLLPQFPQLRLLLVGTGQGQRHNVEPQLQRDVQARGLGAQIIFAGYQTNEALYYRLFDLFVLPTRDAEPFATTVVQAMMAGKPVVAANNGGTPELVVDGETGLLVPAAQPSLLAAALQRLLEDPALQQQLAQKGQARVLQYHREVTTTAQLSDLYRRIIHFD